MKGGLKILGDEEEQVLGAQTLFSVRATVGTLLSVWLCQSVGQALVS